MPISRNFATFVATVLLVLSQAASPVAATPSTSRGQISVAQVKEMLDKAPKETIARQVLTAYLAAVGETAGALADAAGFACKTQLVLSDKNARKALDTVTDKASWAETPATSLIVQDMISRAGCKIAR